MGWEQIITTGIPPTARAATSVVYGAGDLYLFGGKTKSGGFRFFLDQLNRCVPQADRTICTDSTLLTALGQLWISSSRLLLEASTQPVLEAATEPLSSGLQVCLKAKSLYLAG